MRRPRRIRLSRRKGWRLPADTLKVDRSTRWGNPFRVDSKARIADRAKAVAALRDKLTRDGRYEGWFRGARVLNTVEDIRRELAGRNLACWCPLDEPCHADVLLDIANSAATS